jgi:hypothetical protein
MLRTTIALITAIVVGGSLLGAFGSSPSAEAVSGVSTTGAVSAAAALTALSPVTNDPQQLAKVIVAAQKAGNFSTDPGSIYDREIAPAATGQVIDGCGVDVRILQVIVLTLNRFGSARVSDIERPCIGSNLNCGAPTYSVHCLDPGEAIDFANVGGVTLNGSNTQTRNLLSYLDHFVPSGTNAGQQECRASNPLPLTNISQFSDSCNHQHIDFRNTNQPMNAAALASVLPTIAQASPYVKMLYNDYLNRAPSADEITGWATQLANGAPRNSVSTGFVDSDEYRLIRINAAYQRVLGRGGDATGIQNWLNAMYAGTITTDDIETSFYASAEYYQKHGNTDLGFVASLYTTLLNRNGSASDYAFWTNLVALHGRAWVITQFWSSQETISERISLMYQTYLGRQPDAGGLAGWVAVALQIGDSGLRSALTSSDEYWALSQSGNRPTVLQPQVQRLAPAPSSPETTPAPAPSESATTPTPAPPPSSPSPTITPAPPATAPTPAATPSATPPAPPASAPPSSAPPSSAPPTSSTPPAHTP